MAQAVEAPSALGGIAVGRASAKALSLSSVLVRGTSEKRPTHGVVCDMSHRAGDSSTFGRIEPIHLDAKMHMVEVAALVVFL